MRPGERRALGQYRQAGRQAGGASSAGISRTFFTGMVPGSWCTEPSAGGRLAALLLRSRADRISSAAELLSLPVSPYSWVRLAWLEEFLAMALPSCRGGVARMARLLVLLLGASIAIAPFNDEAGWADRVNSPAREDSREPLSRAPAVLTTHI